MATAIELAAEGLPSSKGRHLDKLQADDGTWIDIFEDVGLQSRYKHLVNKHYAELERELGNEQPGLVYEYNYMTSDAQGRFEAFTTGEETSP